MTDDQPRAEQILPPAPPRTAPDGDRTTTAQWCTPVVADVDGRIFVTWPEGRGRCLVEPNLIEGWAEQVNALRTALAVRDVELAGHRERMDLVVTDRRSRVSDLERLRAQLAAAEDGLACAYEDLREKDVELGAALEDVEQLRADLEAQTKLTGAIVDERDQALAQVVRVVAANREVQWLRGLIAGADQYGDRHVIDLREDGWTIAHPLSCRAAGLFACALNGAAADLAGPPRIGKFAVRVEAGRLVIGQRIDEIRREAGLT